MARKPSDLPVSESTEIPKNSNVTEPVASDVNFSLRISLSLQRKLVSKAAAENVSVDEFAAELLAEGLVLRAWEIMERKSALKSGPSNRYQGAAGSSNRFQGRGSRSQGGQQQRRSGGNHNQNQGGRRGVVNHQAILENSANFLEYVRNQEKHQR